MASKNFNTPVWRNVLVALLAIQGLAETTIGFIVLFNFPLFLQKGFGGTYSSDLDLLGVLLALFVILLGALLFLSAFWTFNHNYHGTVLGLFMGLFLLAFGLGTYIKNGDTLGILVDGIRGLVTVVLALGVGNQMKHKNKLDNKLNPYNV